jgi:hypothetical protein
MHFCSTPRFAADTASASVLLSSAESRGRVRTVA